MIMISPSFAPSLKRLSRLGVLLLGLSLVSPSQGQEPADIFVNQGSEEYDGGFKFPILSTDPPGLNMELTITPRSQSEVVFQTIPAVSQPSYISYGINNLPGDKAFGDEVVLGGSHRFLESIEVAMVNFSEAADWPALAQENPLGYLHPLSIIVYRINGDGSLTLLAQKTRETLIPWRPVTLDDGSEYPFGGIGFNARFNFNEALQLSGKIAVLVSYNTKFAGFEPTGENGPYNDLNVALAEDPPLVGSDEDEQRMLRFTDGIFRSRAFGKRAPIFKVRAFSATPTNGTPQEAGLYRVKATINEIGYDGELLTDFEVTPLEAAVSLSGLRQVADGSPKPVTVTTTPAGLSANLLYFNKDKVSSDVPPTERGLYPVFVTLEPGNYVGRASKTMRLGYSYESWIADKGIPAGLAGKSHDPDFDGRTNLEEYLAASDPGTASFALPPFFKLSRGPDGLEIAFSRNNEAIDASYQLQETDDLSDPGSWRALTIPPEEMMPFLSNERVKVKMPFSGLSSAGFFRLGVALTAPGD